MKEFKSLSILTVVFFALSFASCVLTRNQSEKASNRDKNNQIEIRNRNLVCYDKDNQTEVIFNGEDNKIVFNYLNSYFASQHKRDLIIIEGDGNTITMTHNGAVDTSVNSADTIIIKSDKSHLELIQDYMGHTTGDDRENVVNAFASDGFLIEDREWSTILDTSFTVNKLTESIGRSVEVFDYYHKEAVKGNLQAIYYLGELFQLGVGVQRNYPEAVKYFKIAGKNGHQKSQMILGYIYEYHHEGVGRDIDESIFWYSRCAKEDEIARNKVRELKDELEGR